MKSFFKKLTGANNSDEINKILQLIYTNEPENDRLVLEIVKSQKGMRDQMLPALIAVAATCKNSETAADYIVFLKTKLTQEQTKYLQENLKRTTPDLDTYRLSGFTQPDRAEMFYTAFKRSGKHIENFLNTDRWEHPHREEVFQALLEWNQKHTPYSIATKMFSKEEFSRFLSARGIDFSRIGALSLQDEILSELPPEIYQVNCSQLYLNNCISKGFPDLIFKFSKLKELRIHGTTLSDFPEDWSILSELESLSFTNTGHLFEDFDFISGLPKLKYLTIYNDSVASPLTLISPKKLPLSYEPPFKDKAFFEIKRGRTVFGLPFKEVLSIGTAIGKSKLSQPEKEHYFRMLTQLSHVKFLPELPVHELAAISTISHTAVRNACTNRINQIAENGKGTRALNEDSLIWINGMMGTKKTELSRDLKEQGIKSTFKFSPQITHVVIGKKPTDYAKLEGLNFELISENQLSKFISESKPKFIKEAAEAGDESISENLLLLLRAEDPSNILIGLEMLKTGGVTDNLLEDLIIIQKTCPDAKARKVAKNLLIQNASADWLPIINDTQRFTAIFTEKAQATNKKLEKIASKISREAAAKLSMLFYKKTGRGLRYVLYHFHTKSDIRDAALDALVVDKCFDYHKGLGFKKWTDPETATFWNMKISANVKFDVLEQHPDIEKMILHNCKMHKLPKGIGFAKELKSLDCSFNFLKILPDAIGNCKNLEEINLQMNQFKKVPKELLGMKSLKKIDLRHQRPDGANFSPIVVTADVRAALPGCEILV